MAVQRFKDFQRLTDLVPGAVIATCAPAGLVGYVIYRPGRSWNGRGTRVVVPGDIVVSVLDTAGDVIAPKTSVALV